MNKMKTVSLPDRVKIIDHLREKVKKNIPPVAYEQLIKEIRTLFGCNVGKSTIKGCCAAAGIPLDKVVEREFNASGSPVSQLHVRITKLETRIEELKEIVHKLSLWTEYIPKAKEEV